MPRFPTQDLVTDILPLKIPNGRIESVISGVFISEGVAVVKLFKVPGIPRQEFGSLSLSPFDTLDTLDT